MEFKDYRKMTELERILFRQLFKKDCYSFCQYFWDDIDPHPLVNSKLLQFFCETFQFAARYWVPYDGSEKDIILPEQTADVDVIDVRQDKHLISISVPPRHGKSNIFNVLCSCWLFVNTPIKVASVSHTQDLAGIMNAKRQKLLNSPRFKFFFPEIELITNSTYSLKDNRNGEMYSVPKNAITGMGCDMLVVDDLTSVAQATRDAAEMNFAWDIYTQTLPSRINDINKYVILNIMQRIAPNDIVGRITNDPKLADSYIFVVLQAIFEKETYLVCPISGNIFHFGKGDPLFPERFGDYSGVRSTMTENTWQSQYQQNPTNSDKAVVKEDMIYEADECDVPSIEQADMIYASHDFPVRDKETSDFLGSMLAYKVGSTLYIQDCLEKHMAFVQSVNYVKQLNQIYPGIIQIIEDKANGSPILQQLQNEVPGMQAFQPGTRSKTQRLESASLYMVSQNVVFVRRNYNKITNTHSLSESLINLKNRLLAFPFVEHDDICDAFSMMVLFVFMEKQYQVYGKAFNDRNIIDSSKYNVPYSTIFFNKEGDIWKACEIAIDYGAESKLIVKREILFKSTVQQGIDQLRKFSPESTVFIDCSATEALYGIYQNNVTIENYNVEDFDQSVAQLNLIFANKLMLIDQNCKLIKADIDNFKYDKSKDENVIKFKTQKDGFVACLRSAIRYYGL